MIVFRHSLNEEIHALLNELGVKGFSEAPKMLGVGETGKAFGSFHEGGLNSMILASMEESQAAAVTEKLKQFRDDLAQESHGIKIPLKVFILPCEEAL